LIAEYLTGSSVDFQHFGSVKGFGGISPARGIERDWGERWVQEAGGLKREIMIREG
jgi:hypothetical protein